MLSFMKKVAMPARCFVMSLDENTNEIVCYFGRRKLIKIVLQSKMKDDIMFDNLSIQEFFTPVFLTYC